MRAIAAVLLVLAACSAACSKDAKVRGTDDSSSPVAAAQAKDATMTKNSGDCVTTLEALVAGRLAEVTALEGCTRADADAAFGAAGTVRAAGDSAPRVRYPAQGVATGGVSVTFDGDTLTLVDIRRPEGAIEAPDALLGAPEATMSSKLAGATKQWIYASRGLAVHYRSAEQRYMAILAFPPMTADEFLASPLATIEGPIRDPLR